MGCGCKSDLFVLASNTRLESERNGAPAIYWDDPSNAMKLLGATSVQVWLNILEAFGPESSTYEVALVAQQSTDGVDWDIDSTQNLSTWDDTGKTAERMFVENRAEFGPYVRFGIQVRNSAAFADPEDFALMNQVAVRLSMAIMPYGGDNEVGHGDGTLTHTMSGTGAVVGTVIEVSQFKRLVVGVQYSGVTGTPELVIQTSASSADAGPWYDTDGSLSGTASGMLVTEQLLAYARLYVKTAGGGGTLDSWSHVERSF